MIYFLTIVITSLVSDIVPNRRDHIIRRLLWRLLQHIAHLLATTLTPVD